MDRIIAGRFQTKANADEVAARMAQFVDSSDICIFHNNPPGQHGVYPVGGDEAVDPGAKGAGQSAVGTAVATGIAAGTIGAIGGGPMGAVAAGAVGAYVGSVAGALQGLGENENNRVVRRPGGIILSIHVQSPKIEEQVIQLLQAGNAADIERAEGEWRNGAWVDFDPLTTPRLVKDSQN